MNTSQATKPSYGDKSIHQARLDSEKDLGHHTTAVSGQISESTQQVCHNDEILWRSKRKYHIIGLFQHMLYFVTGIFVSWFFWAVMTQKSLWYVLIAIPCTLFYTYEIYKAFNLKAILLTQNGLLLKTRLSGDIFYPYGSFSMGYSLAVGLCFFERISIFSTHHKEREFIFPCGYDSFGSFKNNAEFKSLCTKYTQNSLETMDMDKMASLYDIYTDKVNLSSYEEINYNVFKIDFEPYRQMLREHNSKELQNDFNKLSTKKQLEIIKDIRSFYLKDKR